VRYHELYEADELPVPVEAIAEDLLGLYVEEVDLGRGLGPPLSSRAPDPGERERRTNPPPLHAGP
jgi:hypothetical protein